MIGALDHLSAARSRQEIVSAMSRFLEEDLSRRPPPLTELASMRVSSIEDIDTWIERIQAKLGSLALLGDDEDRVDRLLSYLLVASLRARQLS